MDRLIDKYTINEIAKKTHISPLSLERLFNYEFDKLDDIKIKGFIKILETEYPNFDFSELKEKFEEYSKKDESSIIEIENTNNTKIYLVVVIIILVIVGVYFNLDKKTSLGTKQINKSQNKIEQNITTKTIIEPKIEPKIKEEKVEKIEDEVENNVSQPLQETKQILNEKVIIIPLEKVWFKVTYLDENKSKEYLTLDEVDLNGTKRIFIKFGHGMIKIAYNGKIIEPNTRKITRVIIENGDINITKKRVKEFE